MSLLMIIIPIQTYGHCKEILVQNLPFLAILRTICSPCSPSRNLLRFIPKHRTVVQLLWFDHHYHLKYNGKIIFMLRPKQISCDLPMCSDNLFSTNHLLLLSINFWIHINHIISKLYSNILHQNKRINHNMILRT